MRAAPIDLLIIGDGAVGIASGIEHAARRPAARTTIVAPPHRPRGASQAAGLMLSPFGEVEDDLATQPTFALAFAALERWSAWLGPRGPEIRRGMKILFGSDDDPSAITAALEACGEPHHWDAKRTLSIPREGVVDATRVLAHLDRVARDAAIERRLEMVVSLELSNNGCAAILASGERLFARHVLIAAGAASTALVESIPALAGRCPRVRAGVGRAFRLHSSHALPTEALRTPNLPSGGGHHYLPLKEGLAYLGASNGRDDLSAAFSIAEATERLGISLDRATPEPVLGDRPISDDGVPLLGRTACEPILIATGTYRDGFTLAPVIAERLIGDLLDDTTRLGKVFKPDRLLEKVHAPPPEETNLVAEACGDRMVGQRPAYRPL